MNKKEARQNQLIYIIQTKGLLPVKQLAAALHVSEMTVRRDLADLQCQPQDSGSIAQSSAPQAEYSLLQALEKANEQKDRIGLFAASLIEPDDVVIIDTGSTTARMLPHIPADKNLTVLCYNANVLVELLHRPGINLLFCGGVYHQNTEMFESPEAIAFIARTRANKVFLSAAGIHQELGITCANAHEVPTKNAVIKSSSQRILLVDSGKFGQVRSSYFCELEHVNVVISDKNLSGAWQQFIRAKDIALYLV